MNCQLFYCTTVHHLHYYLHNSHMVAIIGQVKEKWVMNELVLDSKVRSSVSVQTLLQWLKPLMYAAVTGMEMLGPLSPVGCG